MAEADSNNIKVRMVNLEKQFNKIPAHQLSTNPSQQEGSDNENAEQHVNRYQNQRLYSASLKKMMQKKDASIMLKDEIGESALRLKAAKFGHAISEIVPEYDNTFYLPEKDKFKVPQSMNHRNRPVATTSHSRNISPR